MVDDVFFFSSRRRHTRFKCDWSSDVCSSDLEHVAPGVTLAKVVQPDQLKASLKIAETQARDIQIGQPASIDTHNGVVDGKVMRVDAAVQNGTVTVDEELSGALQQGARPDL